MVYLIYADDLPHYIKYSYTLIFADDIKCILLIASCQESIISKIISMNSHISVLNGNSISRNYRPDILTQYNSSTYISNEKMRIL